MRQNGPRETGGDAVVESLMGSLIFHSIHRSIFSFLPPLFLTSTLHLYIVRRVDTSTVCASTAMRDMITRNWRERICFLLRGLHARRVDDTLCLSCLFLLLLFRATSCTLNLFVFAAIVLVQHTYHIVSSRSCPVCMYLHQSTCYSET